MPLFGRQASSSSLPLECVGPSSRKTTKRSRPSEVALRRFGARAPDVGRVLESVAKKLVQEALSSKFEIAAEAEPDRAYAN